MADLIEKELSYLINGCIFDVHNEVGPGLREECYQKAMEIRLAIAGLPFVSKPRTRAELVYSGEGAAVFEPDLIVSDRLVIELKSHAEGLPVTFFRQTINYLKHGEYELGLLANFADVSADIRRIVFHEIASSPEEDFDAIRGTITPDVRQSLIAIREAIVAVHAELGLGYSDYIYRRMIQIGLEQRGLTCRTDVIAKPAFRDRQLPDSPITPLLVNDLILVQVEAIQDCTSDSDDANASAVYASRRRCNREFWPKEF